MRVRCRREPGSPAFGTLSSLFAPSVFLLLSATSPAAVHAQEEREPGWYDEAELSLVLTAGNSESSSFGLANKLERLFPRSRITFDADGIRIESGTTVRTAVGTGPDDFEVVEETDTETTAENYSASLRYDHELSERSYAYGSGGWTRDRFAGVDARWIGAAGLGWELIETERTTFQADLAATLTSEHPTAGDSESFGGLRFTWDLGHQLTETTKLTSLLVVDESLSETEDLRASFDNAVAVSISRVLALKTGLKLLFDNQPALEEVDLFAAPGDPAIGTVLVPLDELDTQVTVALVVTL